MSLLSYSIAVAAFDGIALIGLWAMLLFRHAVPELNAGLPSIRFHIAAELSTAVILLIGALSLAAADTPTARLVVAVGLGAITYSTVNSPGYYADQGNRPLVLMFGVLAVIAVVAICVLIVA